MAEFPQGSLRNILEQETLKWIFVGGEGGVGKTTCSSILPSSSPLLVSRSSSSPPTQHTTSATRSNKNSHPRQWILQPLRHGHGVVCVCIPEFLSLYETERLVQELANFEMDAHNININQVIFDNEVIESKLLRARTRMQQKYIDQFYMYDDFHITKLPLLQEEVCCVEPLKRSSQHFTKPYKSSLTRGTVEELEQHIFALSSQIKAAREELHKKA